MKAKLAAVVIACNVVLVLYYYGRFLNKALIPGFYVSDFFVGRGNAGYGKAYVWIGLAINSAIFYAVIYWFFWSPKSAQDLRRLFKPSRIVCVLLIVLTFIYLKPVTVLVFAKLEARKSPGMWIVPTPLPNVPINRSVGRKLSYFGYEFEVPWSDIRRERKFDSVVVLNFTNGAFVSFLNPSQNVNALDTMKQEAAKREADVRTIFGDQATRSNYFLRSTILHLTPKDLSLFSSRQAMVGNSIMLTLKDIQTSRLKGGLYSFQTEWLRGFQEGSPPNDTMTTIDGYDAEDREVEIWVGSEKGANPISQGDINRIICSLHSIPASLSH